MLTLQEAIEWVRSCLGSPTKSELFPENDIKRFLDVAIKKVIPLIATFSDEVFNMKQIGISFPPPIVQPLILPEDCLRIKSILYVQGNERRYVHKKDLNEVFAKMTYQKDDREYIYALQGRKYFWLHPLPPAPFSLEFYYLATPPDLTRQPNTYDLEQIIPPFIFDIVIAYAVSQCFLKINEVNGYQIFLKNFYDSITILQQTLQISPPKGAINPFTPHQ